MSYLEQLKSENPSQGALSKLPKPPFDSFDSRGGRHFSEKKAPSAVDISIDDGPRTITVADIYQAGILFAGTYQHMLPVTGKGLQ